MESFGTADEPCCSSDIHDGALLNIQRNKLVLFCIFFHPQKDKWKWCCPCQKTYRAFVFHRAIKTDINGPARTDEAHGIVYSGTKGTEFREISADTQRHTSTIIYKWLRSSAEGLLKCASNLNFFFFLISWHKYACKMYNVYLSVHLLQCFSTFNAA